MTPEERQGVAKELRERYYGKNALDVRAALKLKWNLLIFPLFRFMV